jgi:hypothetical protein
VIAKEQSVERTAEKLGFLLFFQPSVYGLKLKLIAFPSSKLLGYFQMSGARTENVFSAKASSTLGCSLPQRNLRLNSELLDSHSALVGQT